MDEECRAEPSHDCTARCHKCLTLITFSTQNSPPSISAFLSPPAVCGYLYLLCSAVPQERSDSHGNDHFSHPTELMKDVIHEEEDREILQTDLRPMDNLLIDINTLFQDQEKEVPEALKIWMQLLHNSFSQGVAYYIAPNQDNYNGVSTVSCATPGDSPKKSKNGRYFFITSFKDFSIFVSARQIVHRDPIPAMSEDESVKPLSKDEAWMLFRRIAFKNDSVSMDIEECARNIAQECTSLPLAIRLVAAAMMGKTRVDEWKTSLCGIKIADPSFPDTRHRGSDPKLYQLIKWSYDALPNSNVKNCFLSCAMYFENETVYVEELVQLWIAEGFVRSKQESHLIDMAVGRSYVHLLVDRCLFQNVTDYNLEPHEGRFWGHPFIKVHSAIRDMAIYIGEKEENCFFKAGQWLKNFPTIQNEDCKRISLRSNILQNLLTEFTRPKLVSLVALANNSIKEVPSGFLVRLTYLKVLDLHYTTC